jgi:predicted extracellular nuclease
MLSRSTRIPFLLILLSACSAAESEERWSRFPEELPSYSQEAEEGVRTLFYNCENLYDTLDAEDVDDDAFTPDGRFEWNSGRYEQKVDRVAEVIGEFASAPDLVGLAEIENLNVLQELCDRAPLGTTEPGILHHRSRDPRGIDLALLFDPERFHPYDRKAHRVTNPGSGTPSRPILSIGLESAGGDSLRVFLCHWPSRAGGKEATADSRMNASHVLQDALAELHRKAPHRKVLIMGDLNDHPPDQSVRSLIHGDHGYELLDLYKDAHAEGKGTYNYRGEWGVLDHFILNEELRKASSGLRYRTGSARILRRKELLYYDEEGEHHQPDRFMERGDYYGGYSDHLPILLEMSRESSSS